MADAVATPGKTQALSALMLPMHYSSVVFFRFAISGVFAFEFIK